MIKSNNEDLFKMLEKDIPDILIDSFIKKKVLSELDVQFQINKYIETELEKDHDEKWRLFNCYYLNKEKKFPDIIFFKYKIPIICIELKFFNILAKKKKPIIKIVSEIKADILKLNAYLSNNSSFEKTYSINVLSLERKNFIRLEALLKKFVLKKDFTKVININLHEISNYNQICNNYKHYFNSLKSNFSNIKFQSN